MNTCGYSDSGRRKTTWKGLDVWKDREHSGDCKKFHVVGMKSMCRGTQEVRLERQTWGWRPWVLWKVLKQSSVVILCAFHNPYSSFLIVFHKHEVGKNSSKCPYYIHFNWTSSYKEGRHTGFHNLLGMVLPKRLAKKIQQISTFELYAGSDLKDFLGSHTEESSLLLRRTPSLYCPTQ